MVERAIGFKETPNPFLPTAAELQEVDQPLIAPSLPLQAFNTFAGGGNQLLALLASILSGQTSLFDQGQTSIAAPLAGPAQVPFSPPEPPAPTAPAPQQVPFAAAPTRNRPQPAPQPAPRPAPQATQPAPKPAQPVPQATQPAPQPAQPAPSAASSLASQFTIRPQPTTTPFAAQPAAPAPAPTTPPSGRGSVAIPILGSMRGRTFASIPRSGGSANSRYFQGPRGPGGKLKHAGMDIGGRFGDQIAAFRNGKVLVSAGGYNGGYGNYVDILYDDGTVHRYAHNQTNNVVAGQTIKAGQIIATVGDTGNARGSGFPHLHWEVFPDTKNYRASLGRGSRTTTHLRIDPLDWVSKTYGVPKEDLVTNPKAPKNIGDFFTPPGVESENFKSFKADNTTEAEPETPKAPEPTPEPTSEPAPQPTPEPVFEEPEPVLDGPALTPAAPETAASEGVLTTDQNLFAEPEPANEPTAPVLDGPALTAAPAAPVTAEPTLSAVPFGAPAAQPAGPQAPLASPAAQPVFDQPASLDAVTTPTLATPAALTPAAPTAAPPPDQPPPSPEITPSPVVEPNPAAPAAVPFEAPEPAPVPFEAPTAPTPAPVADNPASPVPFVEPPPPPPPPPIVEEEQANLASFGGPR